ncbi:hypothetical protein BDP27DRAFT_1379868 [Rhodocollybia butyracea]|uniref:CASTOR ACT domain-containing protein n=1 Tax=Rhodocollybia butyracea TaxID=206335 RepID=A0A9P5Q8R7_9AGAR|nr:hypothetical protein BDP27DRAFT_1379868 [Rhodocollybia butyracea]
MQVTISLLPVSLSLVRIPRYRCSEPHLLPLLIRQVLQPSPTFLNLTCNEIEFSIFAETHALDEFESIARRDRQKQRSRSGSGSSHHDSPAMEPVQISYEKWNVLQIDSHSDALDNAQGARVFELSAPLATAGISILYQSSYLSDFIFVKEARLQDVMSLFSAAGFDIYSSSNSLLSPPPSPLLDSHDESDAPAGAVLTRTRTTDSLTSSVVLPAHDATESRNKSHSPVSTHVRILSPDLACVGLSDEHVDHWSLKIIKLIAFPDLIPTSKSPRTTPKNELPTGILFGGQYFRRSSSDDSYLNYASSSSSDDDDDSEEGYFSHSPASLSGRSLVTSSTSSCVSDSAEPRLGSSPRPPFASPASYRPSSKHLMGPLSPLSPITPMAGNHASFTKQPSFTSDHRKYSHSSSRSRSTSGSGSAITHRIPFFNITRTLEGTSFTTDVEILARLFPPRERYMVVCGGELDAADEQIARQEEEEFCSDGPDDDSLGRDAETSRERPDLDGESGLLKCLQIDLRNFGLDKHGLVNRFSRVLEENGINHMQSSTYKTANLLVSKRHASRAQALLRAC